MSSLEKWQEITTQNIAASSVTGFKKTEFSFEAVANGVIGIGNGFEAVSTATHKATATPGINFDNGVVQHTGVPTHMAINGNGFFKMENGDVEYFSRDGEFRLNADGIIVNKHGHKLLGDAGELRILPENGEISISSGGQIKQGEIVVGSVSLYDFEDKSELVRAHGGFMLKSDTEQEPEQLNDIHVVQGNIEASNVSTLNEMVNLISISRAYEANQKVIQNFDNLDNRTIEVLGDTT